MTSNKQYKKCHLSREEQQPLTIGEILSVRRRIYSQESCLHAGVQKNCDGRIVRAHTIQRNGGLSKIALNGHVISLKLEEPPRSPTPEVTPILLGIKKASIFTGFFSYHDTSIFSPIENFDFQKNQEHTFLLAYRAFCKEYYLKQANLKEIALYRQRDRGKDLFIQVSHQFQVDGYEEGVRASLREFKYYKDLYDKAFRRNDYSEVNYYIVSTSVTPDFLCSGAFLLEVIPKLSLSK